MNKIIITYDSDQIEEMVLEHGSINIGRARDNEIHLTDETLSGHHARIVTIFNACHIEDMGSTNGTFVNDKKVIKHTLHDGDIITVGNCHIKFNADTPAHSEKQNETIAMSDDKLKSMLAEAAANKQETGTLSQPPPMKSVAPDSEQAPVKPKSVDYETGVETRFNPVQANQGIYQPKDEFDASFDQQGISKRSIILLIVTIAIVTAFVFYILKLL
jgi:predicted component of type VI protein secretion system